MGWWRIFKKKNGNFEKYLLERARTELNQNQAMLLFHKHLYIQIFINLI